MSQSNDDLYLHLNVSCLLNSDRGITPLIVLKNIQHFKNWRAKTGQVLLTFDNYQKGISLEQVSNQSVEQLKESKLTSNTNFLVKQVAEDMLVNEYAKVTKGEFAKHSYTMLVSRLNKHIYPFFSEVDIRSVDNKKIYEFYNYLEKFQLSSISISQYMIALRKVLQYALAQEYVQKIPVFPKIKMSSVPRGGFSIQEYYQLLRAANHLRKIKSPIKPVTHRNKKLGIYTANEQLPYEFVWLIRFMVSSFVRPVDIKLIKHQHITIVRGKYVYLRIQLPETKKHSSQIVTLSNAVGIYEALKKYMDKLGYGNSSDYLFLPHISDREAAIYIIGKHFRQLLEFTGLRKGNLGQNRTLYSLRHTAITFRLLYGKGIDLLTLARNARTSVEMIDRFYASNLTAEMNIGLLQSRR
jgi:Phage integrase SAM-like domain